jgi:hypothetical protein
MATVRVVSESGALESIRQNADSFLSNQLGPDIANDARMLAPVDTGRLASSIGHHLDGHTLIVEATASYAAFVELGHLNFAWGHFVESNPWVEAQPYLQPALYTARRY